MCSLPIPLEPLCRVAVTGGTHGNEMSGVYLARHWLRAPGELQRPSFSAVPVLANPAATAVCRRHIGRDLNRTFTNTFLTSKPTPDEPYEVTRARELNQLLGPKNSSQAFDFLLDLHNTTANMGTCFILNVTDIFAMHLCHRLQLQHSEPRPRVVVFKLSQEETFSIDSVAKHGMTIELGPQPQGVLQANLFSRMRSLVASTLDLIELFNQGTAFPAFEMEVYRFLSCTDFPHTEDGDLAGMVHPQLQDQDFEPLQPGAPIFQMFSGEDVLYEGDSTVYPVFINEAAYYEKNIAFMKTEKVTVSIPALPVLSPAPAH
ncbi:PREDICTED: N-acyl-aromatic-L-amino acid amidohydrolase (carboxylate-forming) [Chinchilla lanigera]|uniref:N-acyl-aromatic-L-amino acid amidohydrolase n=1 Tax=Chinchilla lanigera TaxID=34839 RepID=A0A8C2W675_CHILA|nr:PREDICTED: N-acyl-aromatic-L-amino acid amidohydrolase (carboxylate-forming) [Chinchilla lanigera]XP_005384355.1 PREDICTED: N-acyl-aromatic-L-amino acid amidohydrolase (carboxylate-forming) [Chinchilla lanigera]